MAQPTLAQWIIKGNSRHSFHGACAWLDVSLVDDTLVCDMKSSDKQWTSVRWCSYSGCPCVQAGALPQMVLHIAHVKYALVALQLTEYHPCRLAQHVDKHIQATPG